MARELLCCDIDGFSLHAAVRVEAHERKRLERLCWWCRRGRPRMRKRQALPHPALSAKPRPRPRPPKLGPDASAGHGCSSGCSIDIGMQRCPNCGAGELKIIAAILERPVIEKILAHLGLDPPPPPPKGRAREAGPHVAGYAACAVGHLSPRAAATLQPWWRCALCRQAMANIRVNPETGVQSCAP